MPSLIPLLSMRGFTGTISGLLRAEWLPLTGASLRHEFVRRAGRVVTMMALYGVELGVAAGLALTLGAPVCNSDQRNTVGNCVRFRLNWLKSAFQPALCTRVIFSRLPLKGVT